MRKKDIVSKINTGDTIAYKFTEKGELRKGVVTAKKPDSSGVWINGIVKDSFFIILADEIVDVIEAQKA
jgi:hypothetical protein